jgi:enoyl-CoA hydratase/carnithine racemase
VHHTGQDYEAVEAALERDNFMTAEDAKDWGLIDDIVTRREEDDAAVSDPAGARAARRASALSFGAPVNARMRAEIGDAAPERR